MFKRTVISQEVLMAGLKNKIGEITEAFVTTLRDAYMKGDMKTLQVAVPAWMKAVRNTIGIRISFELKTDIQYIGATVSTAMAFTGHGGTQYWNEIKRIGTSYLDNKTLVYDRQKGFASGPIVDATVVTIILTGGLVSRDNGLTDRNVTAAILHEFGHAMGYFESLGDYVYLNAYLAEGIEVLQGLKEVKSQTIVLSDEWLEKNVPKEEWDKFANDRSEINARRVLLHAVKLPSRGHITDSKIASRKRDEQTADLFVSRLGYGRDLAVVIAKLDEWSPNSLDRGKATWMGETIKAMNYILIAPAIAYVIMAFNPLEQTEVSTRYDNGLERMMKIRRDLIQQSKIMKDTSAFKSLTADIEAIDVLAQAYGKDRGLMEKLITFFRPSIRKMENQLHAEQQLEELINNDLFFNVAKLKSL